MITFIIKIFVGLFGFTLVLLWIRTYQLENSEKQVLFSQGSIPSPLPIGLYTGKVDLYQGSWMGKKFDTSNSSGINIFRGKNGGEERYPFSTYVGQGLRDKNMDVLKIDYNIKGNPFWLRRITDEIMKVDAETYLGKLHIRLIPGFVFTLSYFELKKINVSR